MMRKSWAVILFMFFCLSPAYALSEASERPLKIVASFSLLGDMVAHVGGSQVEVYTLAAAGQDAHSFEPSPEAVRKLAEADIVAINGLKFEPWMGRLVRASGTKARLLVASAGVRPRIMNDAHDPKDIEIHPDPHAWQDLRNGALYVKNIYGALAGARPEATDIFRQNAKVLRDDLLALDAQAREAFSAIPAEKRKIITSHDAFGYFAQAYGLTVVSPIGINSEETPSAKTVAKLIEQIKAEGIKALFIESLADPRLMLQIAQETNAKIGGTLYADTLTEPKGEAPTYLDMMKINVRRITEALR